MEGNPLISTMVESAQRLKIIYEDESIIAINKPSGMLSVQGNEDVPSVESIIKKSRPDIEGPIIIHRLDMDTSGIMLLAKNKTVHKILQTQFFKHEIKKTYLALLDGTHITQDKLHEILENDTISLPLAPNPCCKPKQMINIKHGKESITRYKITDYSDLSKIRILFYPQTGRTHQLRVHASCSEGLGCPILGDRLYGKENKIITIDNVNTNNIKRLYLQAIEIEFTHPSKNTKMNIIIDNEF